MQELHNGEMEAFTDEILDKIMNINVDPVFRMCSVLTPMKTRRWSNFKYWIYIRFVSNIPQPQVAYNIKAAVHMMTKSLASDFADQNIRLMHCSWLFRTEMTKLSKTEHWYPTWDKRHLK